MFDKIESKPLLGDEEEHGQHFKELSRRSKWAKYFWAIIITLSVTLNCFLGMRQWQFSHEKEGPVSHYASLRKDRVESLYQVTEYSSEDDNVSYPLWHDINIDAGVVALPDDFVKAKGLVPAQRFPWDESKGIYVINGFHNLHCLKIMHIAMEEFRGGQPQSRKWEHLSHCFDTLRRQILCEADDTPRVTEKRPEAISGMGQYRQCRDWNALESWARKYTACYRRPERPVEGMRNIDKYKFCPDDSGYEVDEGEMR